MRFSRPGQLYPLEKVWKRVTPHACVYAAFRIPPKRAGIGRARSEEDTRIMQADAPPPKTQSKKHLGYEVSGRNE